jgi:hypothetical protein
MIKEVKSKLDANKCDALLTKLILDERKYNELIKEDIINSTDEFAVNHIEGYTVESVRYIRDTNGNWRTVSVDYKRI